MKAITTRFNGPTNTRGARISADDGDGNRVYEHYQHELSGMDVHVPAVVKLCKKMKWTGKLVGGSTKNGYVWVFLPLDVMLAHRDRHTHDVLDLSDGNPYAFNVDNA